MDAMIEQAKRAVYPVIGVLAALVTLLPTGAVAAAVPEDSVWSGTFTYTGTLDWTLPYGDGTVHLQKTQTMTAGISATLTYGGSVNGVDIVSGFLSGPASGAGDYTRVFDYTEQDDSTCVPRTRHVVTTEHIAPTSVDGPLPQRFMWVADDGTFMIEADGGSTVPGVGTEHTVITGGCNPSDTTNPYQGYITAPEPAAPAIEGTLTGDGTTIDGQAHSTQPGWDATYTYHLTKSCAPGVRRAAAVCGGLVADAGGSYDTVRASTVTLDGSKSRATAPATITGYDWSWTPGAGCPSGTTLASSGGRGARLTITVLCGLNITLKVTDSDGHTATGVAAVTVTARGGQFLTTPADKFTVDRTGGGLTGWTEMSTAGGRITSGQNVPTCATPAERNNLDNHAVFCPYKPFGRTHRDAGYALATVADRNGTPAVVGPFDGFAYVASTDLEVRSTGALNPNLRDGAAPPAGACRGKKREWKTCRSFFDVNKLPGSQLTKYVDEAVQHEGWGAPGQPLTGHAGAMREAARTAPGNVRARLEELVSRAPGVSQETFAAAVVDPAVEEAETAVFEVSKDSLPLISTRRIYLFVPAATAGERGRWRLFACNIGGEPRCDRV
jgi:hypothetical protein